VRPRTGGHGQPRAALPAWRGEAIEHYRPPLRRRLLQRLRQPLAWLCTLGLFAAIGVLLSWRG
jgi:hypothetical protein